MPERIVWACLLLFAAAPGSAATESSWALDGYYKNLLLRTETFIGPEEVVTLDMNRLRLDLSLQFNSQLSANVQYDNELLLGNYLETPQYEATSETNHFAVDLDHTYARDEERLARHSIYRATLEWKAGRADIKLGRQRIAWGTGKFWSPLDVLNPFSPIRIEREERTGVDAALVQFSQGAVGRVDLVYAPSTDSESAATAAYLHSHAGAMDYSLMAGNIRGDRLAGADFAGHLGQQGVRGEFSYTNPLAGRSYSRMLLGFDYSAKNTLNCTLELYFNGAGESDPSQYANEAFLRGSNLARKYAGFLASYEVTPLLSASGYVVANLDDHSQVLSPQLSWSMTQAIDLDIGAQFFLGSAVSEYGRVSDLVYVQFQIFF